MNEPDPLPEASTTSFMPHGHCYLWQPTLLSLHVGADALIFLSYLSISMTAVMIVTRIKEVPFHAIYFLFGTFIFACGLTHLMEIWNVWIPTYWLAAGVKVVTALASLGTALTLPFYFSKIRALANAPLIAASERSRRETTERQTQLQLIQSAKMSSLGEMAGGIVHEINNPLTIILGKSLQIRQHLASGQADPAFLAASVQSIEKTSARIEHIVRGMRAFCRQSESDKPEKVLLSTVIDDTITLCRERFQSHHVRLSVLQNSSRLVECRPTQLSQVLLNLLNNAFDAVEHLDDRWVEVTVEESAHALSIHVTDSGKNIAPEIAQKIMQPFFTTKGVGKGTGLGLSISRSLVERQGGCLIHDASWNTTRFTVMIPMVSTPSRVA